MNKFISESDVAEQKKQRQLEWEKVRKAEDPVEVPEAPVDARSLYERLQEQTDKKQAEFEEKIKFKNQFRGIDEDEASFLDTVARRALEHEKQQRDEEGKELKAFRQAMLEQRENNDHETVKISTINKKVSPVCSKQSSLLKKAVKRKSVDKVGGSAEKKLNKQGTHNNSNSETNNVVVYPPSLNCVAVLPGIGGYGSGSDSDEEQSDHES
ncbi:PSME3-interacting protein-like [Ciona intestinalis]